MLHNRHSRRNQGITAMILAVLFVCVVFLSVCFLTVRTHHDCSGDDCPVCATIQICEQTVHQMGDGMPVIWFAALFVPVMMMAVRADYRNILYRTPVRLKVRMDH